MKNLLITGDQLKQIFEYLNEQPHKFSSPLVQYLTGLVAAAEAPTPAVEAEEPAAERE